MTIIGLSLSLGISATVTPCLEVSNSICMHVRCRTVLEIWEAGKNCSSPRLHNAHVGVHSMR